MSLRKPPHDVNEKRSLTYVFCRVLIGSMNERDLKRIRAAKDRSGITYKQLGEATGYTPEYVWRLLNSRVKTKDQSALEKIAAVIIGGV